MTFILDRRVSSPNLRAFFMPIHINFGSVPPCGALMRPLPVKVKVNGKGRTVFYSPKNKRLSL